MSRILNVLFLCSRQLRALDHGGGHYLNAAGKGRFAAHSAGSHPTGEVNPFALELLRKNRIDTAPPALQELGRIRAPARRRSISSLRCVTKAAGEVCPIWPGQPITAHWGVDDPAAVKGTTRRSARRSSGSTTS